MSTSTSVLDKNGYPKNPNSIYMAIQRKFFPDLDSFRSRLGNPKGRIGILVRYYGQWETLHGRVTKITEFPDGVVIHYPQILNDSPLNWPDAVLWIPNIGTIGILNPQPLSNEEIQAGLDEVSQRHMEDSLGLAYIIEWLFKFQYVLPDGTTKDQVEKMTQFKRIELLERIGECPRALGETQVQPWEICQFVREVDKFCFRTADDFEELASIDNDQP